MEQLSTAQVQAMSALADPPKIMSTRERRARAIELLKNSGMVTILEGYEDCIQYYRMTCGVFKMWSRDKKFQAAGLKNGSAGEISDFFHWSRDQMHLMFCYCHHHLDVKVEAETVIHAMKIYGNC